MTGKVHQSERCLRCGIALLRRLLVPIGGCRKIFLHPVAVRVEYAETELSSRTALRGGEFVPMPGFPIIRLAPGAARIDQPGIGLRVGDPLLGGRPAPA